MPKPNLQSRKKATVPSSGTAARILNSYFRFALISTREKTSLRGNVEVAWRCRSGHDFELEGAAVNLRAIADSHGNLSNTGLAGHWRYYHSAIRSAAAKDNATQGHERQIVGIARKSQAASRGFGIAHRK